MADFTEQERAIIGKVLGRKLGTPQAEHALLLEHQRDFKRQAKIAEQLLKRDPTLGFTALLIAGDIVGARRVDKMVKLGMRPSRALGFVGSFARFDWAVRNLPAEELFPQLCELWQAADPDDSDPRFLKLWHDAWLWNGQAYLKDRSALPLTKHIKVWRGQLPGCKTFGIAWSRSRQTAIRFAKGASYRRPTEGVLWSAWIARPLVYGYVTGRGEQEVIVDPENLIQPTAEAEIKRVPKESKDA